MILSVPPVSLFYIPLITFHLAVCLGQFAWLILLLISEARSPALVPVTGNVLPMTIQRMHQRILDLSQVKALKKWFEYWIFTLAWVLFHIAYDIYAFVSESDFYNAPSESTTQVPKTFLFFYVLSLTFRTDDHVLSVPGIGNILFEYHKRAKKSQNPPQAEVHNVYVFLFWASSILPSTAMVLFNAAMYFGFSDDCSDLFGCVYTWDHWYMSMSCLTLVWFLLFDHEFDRHSWENWLSLIFLSVLCLWTFCVPLWFTHLIRMTLLSNMYYQSVLATVSLLLLHQHYSPE